MQAYVAKIMAEGPGQQNRARALLAPPSAPHAREAGAPLAVDPPSTVPGGAPGGDGGDGSGAEDDDQPLDRQVRAQASTTAQASRGFKVLGLTQKPRISCTPETTAATAAAPRTTTSRSFARSGPRAVRHCTSLHC